MASVDYSDDSSDTNFTQTSLGGSPEPPHDYHERLSADSTIPCTDGNVNIVNKLFNRQLYGRIAKHSKAKTEKLFHNVYYKCRYRLDQIVPDLADSLGHIYMGFTICGQYFISYTERLVEEAAPGNFNTINEYVLYIWRFIPGERLRFISKHRIFKLKTSYELHDIRFMQFPSDPYKLICYGIGGTAPVMAYVSVLTLPASQNCKYCKTDTPNSEENVSQGWCSKHGFILHYMVSMSQPPPDFDPDISLAFPDHLVINTGHYIHILNVSSMIPPCTPYPLVNFYRDDEKLSQPQQPPPPPPLLHHAAECLSEASESATSESFSVHSVVDSILDDFSEYDLEGSDCNKPFHELNISCEPLNVTGRSYHNMVVQNVVESRFKRTQDGLFSVPHSSGLQKQQEKAKVIDKKIAEKAYEFIEENEKCEKLSSFRKKRLADKKYEFSEDNSENIVPFNSLRRERRFLYRSQNRCSLRSPDFSTTLFLNPRSPIMQSPNNSRCSQFSPGSIRSLRNSPHHSKSSPVSPRDSARKFNVYSPSMDSDCSDFESKLVLRQINNFPVAAAAAAAYNNENRVHSYYSGGLLLVDAKAANNKTENPRWIQKVVRRYSSGDFENSSLVSGQSRDDYNIPIELPVLVQTLNEQHLDVVPESKADQITETQLIISQRTFDCEQFVQRRAQKLCIDSQLEYRHCEDYDIKLVHVCPLYGDIICQAVIKIGAVGMLENSGKPNLYLANCVFLWNIVTDQFQLIESSEHVRLEPVESFKELPQIEVPKINCKKVLVMSYRRHYNSKLQLRDYNNCYEIYMDDTSWIDNEGYYSDGSDSDY